MVSEEMEKLLADRQTVRQLNVAKHSATCKGVQLLLSEAVPCSVLPSRIVVVVALRIVSTS